MANVNLLENKKEEDCGICNNENFNISMSCDEERLQKRIAEIETKHGVEIISFRDEINEETLNASDEIIFKFLERYESRMHKRS